MIQVWVVHHLEILGEAARAVSPTTRDRFPAIPWSRIVGMRNVIAHGYFGIDLAVVWAVVERDLSPLAAALADARKTLETAEGSG